MPVTRSRLGVGRYGRCMAASGEVEAPQGTSDERELLLRWLDHLRDAVVRKIDGLSDEQARWTPGDALICLLGIVNHLTHVEWRWIDGGMAGAQVSRSEAEFTPGPELVVAAAVRAYRARAAATDAAVRAMPSLTAPCRFGNDTDLRWVLIHLIEETARHAGHADATRELLDGTTGE
ncbi:DinB family protein [soil metagenome]